MTDYKPKIKYEMLTWAQMASILRAVHREMRRRNPIGINLYAPAVLVAHELMAELATAEKNNPTGVTRKVDHATKQPQP